MKLELNFYKSTGKWYLKEQFKMIVYFFLLPLEIIFNVELEFAYNYYNTKHSGSEFLHRKNKFTGVEQIYIKTSYKYWEWI